MLRQTYRIVGRKFWYLSFFVALVLLLILIVFHNVGTQNPPTQLVGPVNESGQLAGPVNESDQQIELKENVINQLFSNVGQDESQNLLAINDYSLNLSDGIIANISPRKLKQLNVDTTYFHGELYVDNAFSTVNDFSEESESLLNDEEDEVEIYGFVSLLKHKDTFAGTVTTMEGNYNFEKTETGYILAKVEDVPEGEPIYPTQEEIKASMDEKAPDEARGVEPAYSYTPEPPTAASGGTEVTLMVVYTEAARIAAGGANAGEQTDNINAQIALGVATMNTAFANSGVDVTTNLVHTAEVDYTENGDSSIELSRVRNPSDGYMDEVAVWRDTYNADQVTLVTANLIGVSGRAYIMSYINGFSEWQYSVVEDNYISGQTLAHELVHNYGAGHDRRNSEDAWEDYGFGYRKMGKFNTVMAYSCIYNGAGGSCPDIPYFSNPALTYQGFRLGIDQNALNSSNVALLINRHASHMASARGGELTRGPQAQAGSDIVATDSDGSGFEMVTFSQGNAHEGSAPIATYQWYENGMLLATVEKPTINLSANTHHLILVATDENGLASQDSIYVSFTGQPTPPLADAGGNQDLNDVNGNGFERVYFDGLLSLSWLDSISSYEWKKDGATISTVSYFYQDMSVGVHNISLTVTDNQGETDTDNIVVTITGSNAPPVADAGVDQIVIDNDQSGSELVTLDGSGSSDSDGTISTYTWRESGSVIATGVNPIHNFVVGIHTVTLTVTDNQGVSSDDSVTITINPGNFPPTANAGTDQLVSDSDGDGSQSATLDGSSSSDSDGTISTYTWRESGSVIATGVSPTHSFAVGVHTVELTVTDDDGATDTDTVIITIEPQNVAPTANAGPNQTVTDTNNSGAESVTLDGSGSSDSDGTISNYTWRESGGVIATGVSPNPSFAVGVHTVELTVTDNDGATNTDTVIITVNPANVAPTANAGPNQTIEDTDDNGSEDIILDGSGSSDSDGTISTYTWRESGSVIASGVSPTHSFAVGVHTVELTVTDDDGATNVDIVTITITSPANVSPTADAGSNQTVTDTDDSGAESVTLNGSGSSDSDGTISTYTWRESGSVIATGVSPTHSFSVGTHTVELTVTDDDGATDTDTVVITVDPANVAPTANAGIDQLEEDVDGSGNEDIILDGSGSSDSDGTISTYTWRESGSVIATGVSPTHSFAVGVHTVELTVTDDDGATDTDTVIITIEPQNVAPTANAGPNQTVTDTNNSGAEPITLNGSGSTDSDGTIVSYTWRESGSVITSGVTPVVNFAVGVHTVELTVTDDDGATAVDTVLITVEPANVAPTANAGTDQVLEDTNNNGSESVTLDGSSSSDSDGTIVNYTWRESGGVIATGVSPTPSFAVGVHTVELTVTDDDGATGIDYVSITIDPANLPPTANAGPNQNVTDTNNSGAESVTLNGSGSSDSDGTISTYTWRESGSVIATGVSPTHSFSVGTHTVELTVTDDDGATDTDTVVITVDPANVAPTANAGIDQLEEDVDGSGNEDIILDGSGSSDSDGTISTYTWRESGSVIASGVSPTHSFSVGTHTVELTVIDDDGATDVDTVIITIEPQNVAPTANAGPNQTVTDTNNSGAEPITLNGSGSTDSDGTIVSYTWRESGSVITSGVTPVVNFAVGVHTVELTVTDNDGATAVDTVLITVEPANVAPTANAGPNQNVEDTDDNGSEDITLDGSSSSDSDGTISTYTWRESGSVIASGVSPTHSFSVGVHTVELTVTDDDGATDVDTVDITITVPNYPPTADAGTNQNVVDTDNNGSEDVTLNGSGSTDSDGTIASYTWRESGSVIATGVNPIHSFTVGVHTVELTVIDDDGSTDVDTVVITVDPANVAPTANAGANQTVEDTDDNGSEDVTLDGTASSDSDGTIVSYTWRESGSVIATGVSPTYSFTVGVHSVELTVIDDDGASNTDTALITINSPSNVAPTADAGTNQNVTDTDDNGSEDVTLNASSSSDSDGTIVSYTWRESGSVIGTGIGPTQSFTVGVHTVELTVTDDDGATDTDTVVITVDPANVAPTANAGIDQLEEDVDGSGNEDIILDGSGSSDSDGTISTYTWRESGSVIASGVSPTHSFSVGTHTVELTVIDDDGATDVDTVIITIEPQNVAPTANAGPNQTVTDTNNSGAEPITLNGSGSTDSDGTIVSYTWRESGSVITSGVTPVVNFAVGVHTVELTVTDNDGATAVDTVLITVEPANVAPTANAGTDQTITDTDNSGSESVTLNGSSSTDSDGTIVSYTWRESGSVITSGVSPTHSFSVGVHTVELTVTDNDGTVDTDTVVITVNPANVAPTANAGTDQTITDTDNSGSESVTLNGSGSTDSDGTIVSYTWRESGSVITSGVSPTHSFSVGTHTVELTVTDDDGATAVDTVLITVEPANVAPTANAGPNQTVTDTNNSGAEPITLNGSGSTDSDGTIVSYTWRESGSVITSGVTPVVNFAVGVHTVELTVTDNDGATAVDTVLITVEPANVAPTANAGPNQTVEDTDDNGSEDITLDGSSSSDSDGTISTYTWRESGSVIASGVSPTHSFAVGVHTVELTVTDDDGAIDVDIVVVTITSPVNSLPTANAGPNQTVEDTDDNGSEDIILDGSSSSDSDGTISNYTWRESGSVIASGVSPTHSFAVGVHTVELTVTDDDGATDTDTVVITVDPANVAPTANAGIDQSVVDGNGNGSESVSLFGGDSIDSDGTIVSYIWREGGIVIATGVSPTVIFTVGVHTIELSVTDNDGATGTDIITITVLEPNDNPIANAGANQTIMDSNNSGDELVVLDGSSSSDSDGLIVTYEWQLGGSQIATGVSPSYTFPVGTHNVTLKIYDDDGATDTDTVVITVQETDIDGDGSSDNEETAGPNSGDANDDGIADSTQPYVSTKKDSVNSNKYITLQTSTTSSITKFNFHLENGLSAQDSNYDYPIGLISFQVSVTPGSTETFKIYLDTKYDTSNWQWRKFLSSNSTFVDMSSIVTYSTETIGGIELTVISFNITDGGQFDEDGLANGIIIDPSGPAVLGVNTEDNSGDNTNELTSTGTNTIIPVIIGSIIIFGSILSYKSRKKYSHYK
jgi:hypothetical protein